MLVRSAAILSLLNLAVWGQIPGSTGSSVPVADQKHIDPLGRETPRGTIMGFMRAAQKGRWVAAADYLELSHADRMRVGEKYSTELLAILNQGFPSTFETISSKADGSLEDGIPADRERAGAIDLPEASYDLLLTRVNDSHHGKIWLISAETVKQIPEMHAQVAAPWLEEKLPAWLTRTPVLTIPVWQWISPILGALASFVILYLLWLAGSRVWGLTGQKAPASAWWRINLGPLFVIAWCGLTALVFRRLGLPLLRRYYFGRLFGVIAILAGGYFAWRVIDRLFAIAQKRSVARLGQGADSAFLLGRRIVKVLVATITGLITLSFLGFNTSAFLAGLGIGGIAVALAAQKTLENFIGGVTLLTDQAIRVGDSCKLGERQGQVVDISLRSTRIRTLEGSLLSIPNGALATMQIENFADRPQILFRTLMNLRYETPPEVLQSVLTRIRQLLAGHPRVDSGYRVCLFGFAASSIDIEVVAQILTPDFAEFAAIREDLLFRIMDIARQDGAGFAFPSQTLYVTKDKRL